MAGSGGRVGGGSVDGGDGAVARRSTCKSSSEDWGRIEDGGNEANGKVTDGGGCDGGSGWYCKGNDGGGRISPELDRARARTRVPTARVRAREGAEVQCCDFMLLPQQLPSDTSPALTSTP